MSNTEHERFGDNGGGGRGGGGPPSADSGADLWLGGLAVPLPSTPSTRAPPGSRAWAYGKAALLHPSNLIALAGVLMLGLIQPGFGILLFGLGVELFLLGLALKSQWFRRCLDEGIEEAAKAAAQRAREVLIARMADNHRDELARIDGLIKKIHDSEAGRAEPVTLAEDLDLHRLTSSYIRLALAHRACEDALCIGEQKPLRVLIRSLEAAEQTATQRVRAAIRERLAIAYQRAEHEARVREDLEVIAHQLAALVDLVHMRHQKAMTLGPSSEADRFMQDLEETRSAVREIRDLEGGERAPMKSIACA
jgi:hypothetical protein